MLQLENLSLNDTFHLELLGTLLPSCVCMFTEDPQLNQIFKDGRVSHKERSSQRELSNLSPEAVLHLGTSHKITSNRQANRYCALS